MRREPRGRSEITIEQARDGLSKQERMSLEKVQKSAESVYNSLYGKKDNSIRHAHNDLLTEQESLKKRGVRPDPLVIERLKQEFMAAVAPEYTQMAQNFAEKLPEAVKDYLLQNNINIDTLPNELLEDAENFIAQDLANLKNIFLNKFKLNVWIEKINNLILKLNELLKKKE